MRGAATVNQSLCDDELARELRRVLDDVFDGRLAEPARGLVRPGPVLILPPDTTRIHSRAGFLSGVVCRELARRSVDAPPGVPAVCGTVRGTAPVNGAALPECGAALPDGATESGPRHGRWRLGAIMPALGTHRPLGAEEISRMFPACPAEYFVAHRWQTDTVELGRLEADWVEKTFCGEKPRDCAGGRAACGDSPETIPPEAFRMDWPVEVNRLLRDGLPVGDCAGAASGGPALRERGGSVGTHGDSASECGDSARREPFSLIVSIGQVVPHEIAGMANHAKNIFVGTGGAEAIHKSHWLGALYGLERLMGTTENPVRALFDEALRRYAHVLPPILWVLTVVDYSDSVRGIFCGFGRECFEQAAALAEQVNIEKVRCKETGGIRKAVVYLDPNDYHSTWLGNKAVYRTRKALADGGELVILAPDLECFGEDPGLDELIRRYGYHGAAAARRAVVAGAELAAKLSAAAHLIHGSSEGRFTIRYCTANGEAGGGVIGRTGGDLVGKSPGDSPGGKTLLSRGEIESVGYQWGNLEEAAARYIPQGPDKQPGGWNTTTDGERYYFIKNPGLGLWTA